MSCESNAMAATASCALRRLSPTLTCKLCACHRRATARARRKLTRRTVRTSTLACSNKCKGALTSDTGPAQVGQSALQSGPAPQNIGPKPPPPPPKGLRPPKGPGGRKPPPGARSSGPPMMRPPGPPGKGRGCRGGCTSSGSRMRSRIRRSASSCSRRASAAAFARSTSSRTRRRQAPAGMASPRRWAAMACSTAASRVGLLGRDSKTLHHRTSSCSAAFLKLREAQPTDPSAGIARPAKMLKETSGGREDIAGRHWR
mmetsp:Transcript_109914/g.354900  ORF Transcript_109914/g.354900 Transcript_109914/m.354900 type:complete len:258 (+) Transcript_109914:34-807(+)